MVYNALAIIEELEQAKDRLNKLKDMLEEYDTDHSHEHANRKRIPFYLFRNIVNCMGLDLCSQIFLKNVAVHVVYYPRVSGYSADTACMGYLRGYYEQPREILPDTCGGFEAVPDDYVFEFAGDFFGNIAKLIEFQDREIKRFKRYTKTGYKK